MVPLVTGCAERSSHRRVYSKHGVALDPFAAQESLAQHRGEKGEFKEAW
jgi:hypothetical protein